MNDDIKNEPKVFRFSDFIADPGLAFKVEQEDFERILKEYEEAEMKQPPFDMTSLKERKAVASKAAVYPRHKSKIDDNGKKLVSVWKKQAKAVDDRRKAIRDMLDRLKAATRKPLTDWEAQEDLKARRVAEDEATFTRLATVELTELDDISTALGELEAISVTEGIHGGHAARLKGLQNAARRVIETQREAILRSQEAQDAQEGPEAMDLPEAFQTALRPTENAAMTIPAHASPSPPRFTLATEASHVLFINKSEPGELVARLSMSMDGLGYQMAEALFLHLIENCQARFWDTAGNELLRFEIAALKPVL
jgi:hypothetical protein